MQRQLETFNEKTYFAEESIIVTLFGEIAKVEDYFLLHLLFPKHYFLLRRDDLNQAPKIKKKINEFTRDIQNNFSSYVGELVENLMKQLNDHSLNNYLAQLFDNDRKSIRRLSQLFLTNKDQFKEKLQEKFQKKYAGAVAKQVNYETVIASLQKEVGSSPSNDYKRTFVTNQAKRLLLNPHTENIFTDVLAMQDLKMIIFSDYEKHLLQSSMKAGGFKGTGRIGQSIRDQKLITLFFGQLYTEFPSLSLLGGMQSDEQVKLCFERPGPDYMRAREFYKPFLRLLAEESFDFWLATQQIQDVRKLEDKLMQALAAISKGTLEEVNTDVSLFTTYLNENADLASKADTIIQQQNEVVDLVLTDHPLKHQQQLLWKKMLAQGQKIYEAASATPGKILIATPHDAPLDSPGHITLQNNRVAVKFKKFMQADELHCDLGPGKKVGIWETVQTKKRLSEKQIAGLYQWFFTEYSSISNDIQLLYIAQKMPTEFLGKIFGYYIFFPTYIESFMPELHAVYHGLYQKRTALKEDSIACVGDTCVRACETFLENNGTLAGIDLHRLEALPVLSVRSAASSIPLLAPSQADTALQLTAMPFAPLTPPDAMSRFILGIVMMQMAKDSCAGIGHACSFLYSYFSTVIISSRPDYDPALLEESKQCREELVSIKQHPKANKWLHYFLEDLSDDIDEALREKVLSKTEVLPFQKRFDHLKKKFVPYEAELDYSFLLKKPKSQGKSLFTPPASVKTKSSNTLRYK